MSKLSDDLSILRLKIALRMTEVINVYAECGGVTADGKCTKTGRVVTRWVGKDANPREWDGLAGEWVDIDEGVCAKKGSL